MIPLRIPKRRSDAHKGDFGRVLVVGGSRGMSGSISLSAIAALKTGAGLVTAAVPDRCLETVAAFHPAVMTVPLPDNTRGRFSLEAGVEILELSSRASAIGCGPGMTTDSGSIRVVERIMSLREVPRVLDADAINVLAGLQWQRPASELGPIMLTPHPGELQRLTGVSSQDRDDQIEAAKSIARQTGATIVVKGGPTVVVGESQTWTNSTGNPGMATGGSGDVLTGVLTSLVAQGLSIWDAARLGVWIHGTAGDIAAKQYGGAGLTALEILGALPAAIALAESQ